MPGPQPAGKAGFVALGRWRWLNGVVMILLAFGVALSFVLYGIARDAEQQRREGQFAQAVDHQAFALRSTLERQTALLHSLKSFIVATESLDQERFATFAATLLAAETGVQALEWIPYVTGDRREAFEREAARHWPDFRIRQLDAAGDMVPAVAGPEHFPVWLVHPVESNARAVGFDLGSESNRRAALLQAVETGRPAATAPVTLVQEQGSQRAYLVFLPVWCSDDENRVTRELRGFVLGVFRAGDVVESAVAQLDGQSLPMTIVDPAAGDEGEILRGALAGQDDHGHRTVTIDLAGRAWQVTFHAFHHTAFWSRLIPLLLLGSSLLVTLVFCLLVWVVARRNVSAEMLVQERTRDLASSEEKLRTVADLSTDFVFWLRPDRSLNYASPAAYPLSGYRAEEFLEQPELLSAIVHPDDRPTWDDHWRETLAGVPCASLELRIRTRGGEDRWVQHQCRPIQGPDGAMLGVRGKFADITEARAHAQRLERERRLFTGGPVVVFLRKAAAGWPLEYVSPNAGPALGIEADRMLQDGAAFADCIHAEDLARVEQDLDRRVAGYENQFEQHYRIVDGSGAVRFVYEITHVVRDRSGVPTHFEGYVLDVTDREDARQSLQISRQRLDLALAGAGLGLWDWDISSGRVHFDQRWAAMLGYDRSELEPSLETWSRLVHPDDMAEVEHALQEHMAGRTPFYESEHRLRHRDGHWVWVLDRGRVLGRDEDGRPVRAVGTHLDISERRRAEARQDRVQALREQTTRDLARCTSPMAIMSQACRFGQQLAVLTGGTCTFLLRLSGRQPEVRTYHLWQPRDDERLLTELRELNESAGEHWWRLTGADGDIGVVGLDDAGLPAPLAANLRTLGTRSLVVVSIPVAAKRRYLLVMCSHLEPGRWPAQDLETIEVVREYFAHTQQRVAYRQENESTRRLLTLALRRAEQANKVKTSFLARMSHEIRTPLTAIAGLTDILERHSRNLDDVEKVWLRKVRHNSDHLVALLNDLLDLSKIDAGELHINREPVDIADALATVDATLQPRAQEKGIALRITCSPRVPAVFESDRLRLRQILLNLAGNAVKFTDEGRVEVEADFAPAPEEGAGELTVTVRDTGIGIAEDELEVIFEPFLQASDTDLATRGGTGLGLDISRRLARALGGDIAVESRVGEGSTFTLTVPLTGVSQEAPDFGPGAAPSSSRSGERRHHPELAGRRVLVVDDNPDNRQVITYYLDEAQVRHESAENGKLGVEAALGAAAAGEPFDLILMDMRMPVMNGYEAAMALRESACRAPIIALTAHAMDGDKQECLNYGCNAYVSKPIEPLTLLATMARLLQPVASAGAALPAVPATRDAGPAPAPAAARKEITRRLPDDPRFARLVENYRRSLVSIRGDLAAAREAGDHETVTGIAHRLHGTAANFGYPEISESARDCEAQLHAGLAPCEVGELDQLEELLLAATAGVEESATVTETL